MTQALLPEVLREFTLRWGVQPDEMADLLGAKPDEVAVAIGSDREPAGASFHGALLAGVIYVVLADRARRLGSDAAVAAWLAEPVAAAGRRAALLFGARTVDDVGRWVEAAKARGG